MLIRRPRRLNGHSYRGRWRYFLTFCVFARRKIFTTSDVVDPVLTQFRITAEREEFATHAYCFMPDHVHLLVEGLSTSADMRRFARVSKQRSEYHFQRHHHDRLWQPGYYDHVLRDEEDLRQVVTYIMANPIRAKMVDCLMDYRFIGSDTFDVEHLAEIAQDCPNPFDRGSRLSQVVRT